MIEYIKKFYEEDMTNIYSSRTFCLFEDIEKIKSFGLAKGGSLDNALVVKGNSVLNKNGLRNPKEFVNHKILDLAGDFLLSKYRILGKVKCIQGGHYLSNVFGVWHSNFIISSIHIVNFTSDTTCKIT